MRCRNLRLKDEKIQEIGGNLKFLDLTQTNLSNLCLTNTRHQPGENVFRGI